MIGLFCRRITERTITMSETKNISEYLSYDEIIEKAIEKIESGTEDFLKFKDTKVFKKLLGLYSGKKHEDIPPEFKLNVDKGDKVAVCIATGIAPSVSETLISFCKQSGNFAYKVLTSPKSYTHCIAYLVSKVIYDKEHSKSNASISDVETYQNAIKFFVPEGSLSFQLNLDIPDFKAEPVTAFDVANLQLDYKQFSDKAEAEIKRAEEKKAKEKEEKKQAAAKKKEAEEKKKIREQLKKEKEAFEKAQQSFLPVDETEPKEKSKPKAKRNSSPTSTSKILSIPEPVQKVDQLTLFI